MTPLGEINIMKVSHAYGAVTYAMRNLKPTIPASISKDNFLYKTFCIIIDSSPTSLAKDKLNYRPNI